MHEMVANTPIPLTENVATTLAILGLLKFMSERHRSAMKVENLPPDPYAAVPCTLVLRSWRQHHAEGTSLCVLVARIRDCTALNSALLLRSRRL